MGICHERDRVNLGLVSSHSLFFFHISFWMDHRTLQFHPQHFSQSLEVPLSFEHRKQPLCFMMLAKESYYLFSISPGMGSSATLFFCSSISILLYYAILSTISDVCIDLLIFGKRSQLSFLIWE